MTNDTTRMPTPFSGLGFDLSRPALAASALRPRRLVRRQESCERSTTPEAPAVWGYELMLELCRETGGS